jgi:hypothetical protein
VTVATVGRGDVVVVGQVGADADCHGLLAGIKMNETWDETSREVLAGQILERADLRHLLVHTEEGVPIQFHRSGRAHRHEFLLTIYRAARHRRHGTRCNSLMPNRI